MTTKYTNPSLPEDPRVMHYTQLSNLHPAVFSSWREECRSWKETAYISTNISVEMPMLVVKGPDAEKLMNENCVNNMANMKIGAAKHAIMCAENGNIVADGLALRFAEDEYGCYALQPLIIYLSTCGKYDVEPIEYKEYDFNFQVAGPKSLEILEQACEEDLHDIKFMRFRNATIAGHTVRILRIGMAGTLGYEVHGLLEYAHEVYDKIYQVGEPLRLKKLGYISYSYDHAENGFPQSGMHFMFAWKDHKDLWASMANIESGGAMGPDTLPVNGSLVSPDRDNLADCYRNPVELGWANHISWNHDFVGKEALKALVDGPHRVTATLTWNTEDIFDIQASFYQMEEEPYKEIILPLAFPYDGLCGCQQNQVLDENGTLIGKASFPEYSITYRKLFSLAVIDENCNIFGKELTLVWGGPNDRKKHVRVTVDRYPLLIAERNENIDVESIPHYQK